MADLARVTDYLYVSAYNSIQPDVLKEYQITCVINTAEELPSMKTDSLDFPLDYMHVYMFDDENADLLTYLDSCVDKIHKVQQSGGRTLVHCLGGVSRSVSVCAGYLIKYCSMSLKDSIRRIRAVRPQANPNPGFWHQLSEYERFFVHYNEEHGTGH